MALIFGWPWEAVLGFGAGLGFFFSLGLGLALAHAAKEGDEQLDARELPVPRFTSWEVSEDDLEFERIVSMPVEGTVLAHAE